MLVIHNEKLNSILQLTTTKRKHALVHYSGVAVDKLLTELSSWGSNKLANANTKIRQKPPQKRQPTNRDGPDCNLIADYFCPIIRPCYKRLDRITDARSYHEIIHCFLKSCSEASRWAILPPPSWLQKNGYDNKGQVWHSRVASQWRYHR